MERFDLTSFRLDNHSFTEKILSDVYKLKDMSKNNTYKDCLCASISCLENYLASEAKPIDQKNFELIFAPLYNKGASILQKLLFMGKRKWMIKSPKEFEACLNQALVSSEFLNSCFDDILKEGFFYLTFGNMAYISDLLFFWYATVANLEKKIFGDSTANFLQKEKNASFELCNWLLFYIHGKGIHSNTNSPDWNLNITSRVIYSNFSEKQPQWIGPDFVLCFDNNNIIFKLSENNINPYYSEKSIEKFLFGCLPFCELYMDRFLWNINHAWKCLRSEKIVDINVQELECLYKLNKTFSDAFEKDKELHANIRMLQDWIGGKYASPELNSVIEKNVDLVKDTTQKNRGLPSNAMVSFIEANVPLVHRIHKDTIKHLESGNNTLIKQLKRGDYPIKNRENIIEKMAVELAGCKSYAGKKDHTIQAKLMNILLVDTFHRTVEQRLLSKMIINLKKEKPFRKPVAK